MVSLRLGPLAVLTVHRTVIHCRSCRFATHIVPSDYGQVVEKYLQTINGIEKYVIMPNHIHMIIRIDKGPMWASAPTQSIPTLVRSFKVLVTKELGQSIFQRSYYDHVIRGERDYRDVWDYIETNPLRWQEDEYHCEK